MPRIVLDFDPPQTDAPDFDGDTSELSYFVSWAFAARFGASHEMSQAADILRTDFKISLQPLISFADRNVEEPADQLLLDNAWQDAAPLAESCRQVVAALSAGDQRFVELQEEYPDLRANLTALAEIAAWAAQRDVRIRITYELEDAT